MRIESLAIGDELLDGRVADGNTKDLGDALAQLGAELKGARTVPDDAAAIEAALREAAARADVVVTSGGLGPTTDDITAECVARAAGVGLRFDEPAFSRMQAMFSARGIPMPESNRRQAMLPASSTTIENQLGTAPGFVTPIVVGGNRCEVWSFPGVPKEYRHLLEDHLVPALVARGGARRVLLRRTLRSLGLAESAIGERLGALSKDNPDVRVQYRAAFPEIVVRLVVEADAGATQAAEARLDELLARARADVGGSVWSVVDEPFEVQLLRALDRGKQTMSCAESCTGGLVAKRVTDVAGSSSAMMGGVVSYANAAKVAFLGVDPRTLDEHGAVSQQTAEQMAAGARARFGTTWAVSTTGVAGPSGGSADKPVGTVWFGVAGPAGVVAVKKKLPDFGRERVREMAAATALRLLFEHVTGTAHVAHVEHLEGGKR